MSRKKIRSAIHYIYKIIFLCGTPKYRYYYGKRSTCVSSPEADPYHGSGKFCGRYFAKYGVILGETYIKEIIEINPSRKINAKREDFWLGDKWRTDSLCMNMRRGGEGGACFGHAVSEETRKKFSQIHKGNKYCLGKKHTPEAKEKDRIAHLGNKYGVGHKMSEHNKQKLRAIRIKTVKQYTLDGKLVKEYKSIGDAAKITGVCRTKISSCCMGNRFTTGGYIWKYANEELTKENLDEILKFNKNRRSHKEPIFKIDINTGIRTIYPSIREAARITNINSSSISEVCKGKRKTAGGYKWKYVED